MLQALTPLCKRGAREDFRTHDCIPIASRYAKPLSSIACLPLPSPLPQAGEGESFEHQIIIADEHVVQVQ